MTSVISKSYKEISQIFNSIKPNSLIVLGDRFELLPIVSIANLYKIKVFHIHGGEITDGSMDNATRNAISQLSQFHLVSNEKSKKLLIKYGKKSKDIQNTGSLAINQILKTEFYDKDYFKSKKLNLKKKLLVIYHPNTISNKNEIESKIFLKLSKDTKIFSILYLFQMLIKSYNSK